jgi:beta-lactamase class A
MNQRQLGLVTAGLCAAATMAVVPLASSAVAAPAARSAGGASSAGTSSSAAAAASSAAADAICTSAKRPKLAARITAGIRAALVGRVSSIGLTAADPRYDLTCAFHSTWHFDSASAIKATIISALLREVGGPSHLTAAQRSLAWLMITESDNDAATTLWNEVGIAGMQDFLDAAGMRHTILDADAWGLTQLTAHDELTLLQVLSGPNHVLSSASRSYVLWLMAHVVAYERWGVPAGAPHDVTVSVKNGWLPYPVSDDWHVNSIGVFRGHDITYQIAVLTGDNPTMAYGIDTIEAVARVINYGIAGA